MSEPAERPIPNAAPAPAADHRPPDDREIVYFEGRPLMRADQLKLVLWAVLAVAVIALIVLSMVKAWGWPWWVHLALVVVAIVVVAVPWAQLRATRYRITNYRIDYERGILTKQIDTVELWHVEDIHFEQGIIDRMFNVGSITIISNDATSPRLELHGVPNPREIFDSLKQRVIAVKRQRGVLKMDMG